MNTMNRLNFEGKGLAFFKVHMVNQILRLLTLSLMHPWAKVREIRYVCQNLSLAHQPFTFTGTSQEFFKGFLKTFLFFLFIGLLCFTGGFLTSIHTGSMIAPIIYFLTVIVGTALLYMIFPIVLHGSINFRLNNIAWGDVKPSYTGKISELVRIYFSGMVLNSLTLGIYGAWFRVKLVKYLLQHTRFGSLHFDFKGDAKTLFILYLKGILLSILTLGIYGIWFAKNVYNYHIDNILVRKDEQEFELRSDANSLHVFEMTVGNFLLVVLTLGLGASWAYMRYYRFIVNHCLLPSDFNIDSIREPQTELSVEKNSEHWLDKLNPIMIV